MQLSNQSECSLGPLPDLTALALTGFGLREKVVDVCRCIYHDHIFNKIHCLALAEVWTPLGAVLMVN